MNKEKLYKSKSWLYHQYVELQKSIPKIGKIAGSKSTIQRWLVKFNIPVRKGQSGKLNGMYRKHHTEKRNKRVSKILRLKRIGTKNPFYGHHHTLETKNKWNRKKENHPNWQGGIGKLPYPFAFNNKLKEFIHKRDNYVCQLCGIHQSNLMGWLKKLDVHHIDYDKDNLDSENLITLCRKCNVKVNYNRTYWQYFLTGGVLSDVARG